MGLWGMFERGKQKSKQSPETPRERIEWRLEEIHKAFEQMYAAYAGLLDATYSRREGREEKLRKQFLNVQELYRRFKENSSKDDTSDLTEKARDVLTLQSDLSAHRQYVFDVYEIPYRDGSRSYVDYMDMKELAAYDQATRRFQTACRGYLTSYRAAEMPEVKERTGSRGEAAGD